MTIHEGHLKMLEKMLMSCIGYMEKSGAKWEECTIDDVPSDVQRTIKRRVNKIQKPRFFFDSDWDDKYRFLIYLSPGKYKIWRIPYDVNNRWYIANMGDQTSPDEIEMIKRYFKI